MSDPVTNVEIEDVLSSIRRLVSDGANTAADAGGNDHTTATDNRFVLTPSLRIADDPEPADLAADIDDPVDVSFDADPVDEIGDNDNTAAQESGAELDEAQFEDAATFVAPSPLLLTPDAQADVPLIHDAMSDEDRATLEAKIAQLEEAVGATPQPDWEPDGSEVTQTNHLAEMFDDLGTADGPVAAPAVEADDLIEDGARPLSEERRVRRSCCCPRGAIPDFRAANP